jgi:UPF0716 protein FxsA
MGPVKTIAIGLLVLPVAEIAVFILVADAFGLAMAFILLLAVSFAGVLVLRHVGSGAVTRLRAAAGHAEITGVSLDGAGIATGLGGILLVVPGFITGALGLLVIFPLSRQWLLAALRHLFVDRRGPPGPQVVELTPDEWERLPPRALPPRKRRPKA